jgi:hypothetical protein
VKEKIGSFLITGVGWKLSSYSEEPLESIDHKTKVQVKYEWNKDVAAILSDFNRQPLATYVVRRPEMPKNESETAANATLHQGRSRKICLRYQDRSL